MPSIFFSQHWSESSTCKGTGFCLSSAVNTGTTEQVSVTDTINYEDSNIMYTIDNADLESTKLLSAPIKKPVRYKPWTPEWLDQMIRKLDSPQAVGYLRAWMPNRRELEATEATIMALQELDHNDAIIAIKSLKSHKKFV